jgi:ferrous iron transport protein B
MYMIGIVVAPLVALALKRTLLRGETPVFVMELPVYKFPSWKTVLRRITDSAWAFLRRAGTLILAAMILVWALLYFPRHTADGALYDVQIAELEDSVDKLKEEASKEEDADQKKTLEESIDAQETKKKALLAEWKRESYLGQMGRAIEPVVRPLGWDWKIGVAALASFPAREVVVGTLGIIYGEGKVDSDDIRTADKPGDTPLGKALQRDGLTAPVALSLMVFFALCCQCASTLAVMRRETNSWGWPAFAFVYMTVLAYVGALITYQVGRLF